MKTKQQIQIEWAGIGALPCAIGVRRVSPDGSETFGSRLWGQKNTNPQSAAARPTASRRLPSYNRATSRSEFAAFWGLGFAAAGCLFYAVWGGADLAGNLDQIAVRLSDSEFAAQESTGSVSNASARQTNGPQQGPTVRVSAPGNLPGVKVHPNVRTAKFGHWSWLR